MLKPLKEIFPGEVFENPSKDKFAWIGTDKNRVLLLQDFRWSREIISWNDFLLLLEGETVKLPSPKNHFKEDINIDENNKMAIFATSVDLIAYKGPYQAVDSREDAMMASRWKVFEFTHQFEEEKQKAAVPCGRCFSELVLL